MTGTKRGGRARGQINNKTRDLLKEAGKQVTEAKKLGRKSAIEVLDDLMHTAMGMAVKYQPPAPGAEPIDSQKFMEWIQIAGTFAKGLADFQSPKFRAIMVSAPTRGQDAAPTIDQQGNVLDIDDPKQLARAYASMVRRVG